MSEVSKCAICGDPDGDMHNIITIASIPVEGNPSKFPVHRFTTIKPRYWTADDMVNWLKTNTRLADPEYAARWWLGCKWVEGFNDMNGRERIELIVDGSKAIDLNDVTEHLQSAWSADEFGADDPTTIDDDLEADWRTFWRDELK